MHWIDLMRNPEYNMVRVSKSDKLHTRWIVIWLRQILYEEI